MSTRLVRFTSLKTYGKNTLCAWSSKVLDTRGFRKLTTVAPSTMMTSRCNDGKLSLCSRSQDKARSQLWFLASAFHVETEKVDIHGSHDGRTHPDCHHVTDKRYRVLKKGTHHSSRKILATLHWIS